MRTLASTRLTHHWYVPYAPYPLIRACAPTRLYPFSCLLTNTVVSVAPLQKSFEFSVLDQIHPFWVNLVQKTKIVSLSWNLVPVLIWISTIQWWCSVFPFLTENVHLGRGGDKFGPKNQNYQFELKFGTWTNSNMHNSMEILTLSVFDQKYPF